MNLTVPAAVTAFRSLMDGTMRLTVDLQELPPDKASQVLSILNKVGFFTFSFNSEFTEEEARFLEQLDKAVSGDKSQSKRLRSVLFLVHKSNGGDESSFEEFYNKETEKIIEHYKAKL